MPMVRTPRSTGPSAWTAEGSGLCRIPDHCSGLAISRANMDQCRARTWADPGTCAEGRIGDDVFSRPYPAGSSSGGTFGFTHWNRAASLPVIGRARPASGPVLPAGGAPKIAGRASAQAREHSQITPPHFRTDQRENRHATLTPVLGGSASKGAARPCLLKCSRGGTRQRAGDVGRGDDCEDRADSFHPGKADQADLPGPSGKGLCRPAGKRAGRPDCRATRAGRIRSRSRAPRS